MLVVGLVLLINIIIYLLMEEPMPAENESDDALEFKEYEPQPDSPGQADDYFQHPPPQPMQMAYQNPIDPIKDIFRMVKAMLWSTAFISYLAIIVISFIIVLAMTPEIQSWIATPQPSVDDPSILESPIEYIFIIFPFPVLLFTIGGAEFQAWHILMLSLLIGAFAYSNYDILKDWLSRRGQMLLSLTAPDKAKSSLEGVAKLFMACSFFSTMYFIILTLSSIEMETPPFDEFSRAELIYGLFNASVFEELISRVLLIGIPLLAIALVQKWNKPWKKLLGGGLDITPMTMSLITFAAIFFALAHVGSWDLWKVPQVLVTGFALGYAFVRYGLHASIMIHFSINLSSSIMEIWPDSLLAGGILGMSFFIWIVIGCYFFFDYIWRLLIKLKFVSRPQPMVQTSQINYGPPPQAGYQHSNQQTVQNQQTHIPEQPPQYVQPPPQFRQMQNSRGFICPKCGNTGASYTEGRLTCLRCKAIIGESKPAEPEKSEKDMFDY